MAKSKQVHRIVPDLQSLARPIASLQLDPKNANQHDARGIAKIAASLREYGQRKPVVAQQLADGALVVRAGNGTVQAAQLNGWTHLAAVVVEEDDSTATGYAIVDNVSAEYSTLDPEAVDQLLADVEFSEPELVDLPLDLDELLVGIGRPATNEDGGADPEPAPKKPASKKRGRHVLVSVRNKSEQSELIEWLEENGYDCKPFEV